MSESHLSPVVFLSYADADREVVEHLRTDLQAQGVALWIDKEGIPPGNPNWEEALRTAMHAADAVLLVASPDARVSRYVEDELRIAEMYQRPVYSLWVAGERWMDVVPIGWGEMQYFDARAERYQQAIEELVGVLGTLHSSAGLQGPPPEQVSVQLRDVKEALAKHAEATYTSLPSEEYQSVARALFLRLIDPGTLEQEATRRRAALSELVFTDPKETTTMREVMASFTEAGLLTTTTVAGVPLVEVSHEALISEWRRLGDWLHEAREDFRLQKAISEDATEWKRRGKPTDRLYHSPQLSEAEDWQARNRPNVDEEAFLLASVAEREREATAERERRVQEEQQRRRYTRRSVLVGLGGLGLTLAAIGLLWRSSPQVVVQRQVITPPKSLLYSYRSHRASVLSVAWSPDGKRLASASADETVQVWSASTGKALLTYKGQRAIVLAVAWSPDGKRLVSASVDGIVQVWDARTGRLLLTYKGHSSDVWSVAWSPDGKRLASASADRTVQVWLVL